MRVLLDHCVDRRLARLIHAYDVRTAREMGWHDLNNGELLTTAAAAGFGALITTDKNMQHQHDLPRLPLPIIEINAFRNRLKDYAHLAPKLPDALAATAAHLFVVLHEDGSIERVAPRTESNP